jgi:hypothetical protein
MDISITYRKAAVRVAVDKEITPDPLFSLSLNAYDIVLLIRDLYLFGSKFISAASYVSLV